MKYKNFGMENNQIIMLLHGGGLSWWNYQEVAKLLSNDYQVILPILDGHSGSDKNFKSIETNAKEIISFIDEHFEGHILLLGGLSLGGQILLEILSQRENICDYAIIESVVSVPMKMTNFLIKPIFNLSFKLISKRWFSKIQFKSLKIRTNLFDDYYKDTCLIQKADMISFMLANSNYTLKSTLRNVKAHVLVLYGSKERSIIKKSAQIIINTIPHSKAECLIGYFHGDISINHAEEYVVKLRELINMYKI